MSCEKKNQENLKRWMDNRLGMFIHWGLYALPGRHEWVKSREEISDEDYRKYFDYFNPDLYDPAEWARYCRLAGMKYVVLTTKHHDGFCLWDTKFSDYKCTNTPYGKDLLKMFVDAFRAEGIRIGLYHSLIDWHHPEYTLDQNHPMRNNEDFKAKDSEKDIAKYAEYLHNQTREILSNYGEIDLIFFDFSMKNHETGEVIKGKEHWQSEKLAGICRECQPGILINDRLDMDDDERGWDYVTPEQIMLRKCPERNGKKVPWETCQTFSGSWGYYRDEYTWKSVEQLLKLLIDTVSKSGNLLLNVGPTARGEFDSRAKESLEGMGEWLDSHGRSIYGCCDAPEAFETPWDCRLTYNSEANRLYIHFFSWPSTGELYLQGSGIEKVKYAQLLNDASEVKFELRRAGETKWGVEGSDVLSMKLPIKKPSVVPVVELYLD